MVTAGPHFCPRNDCPRLGPSTSGLHMNESNNQFPFLGEFAMMHSYLEHAHAPQTRASKHRPGRGIRPETHWSTARPRSERRRPHRPRHSSCGEGAQYGNKSKSVKCQYMERHYFPHYSHFYLSQPQKVSLQMRDPIVCSHCSSELN